MGRAFAPDARSEVFNMIKEMQPDFAIAPDIVEGQLERLQNSPYFSHSHRYPCFLNYVVRQALQGRQEDLKERTIGIEAFGRAPSYDSNEDPIVRVTASEVRRRLAQYYSEPEHRDELRIELRPGSYVPEFKFSTGKNSGENVEPPPLNVLMLPVARELKIERAPEQSTRGAIWRKVVAIHLTILSAAAITAGVFFLHKTPMDRFWKPTIDAEGPVLILVGSVQVLEHHLQTWTASSSIGEHPLSGDPVALADSMAFSRIQYVLFNYNKTSIVQSSVDATFSDLLKGPIILVSAFNNPWTMRLTDPLRFHFVRTAPSVFEIQDRKNPNNRWAVDTLTPFSEMNRDYGLVARFRDPTTDQIVIVCAGIAENGTIAASNYLSDAKSFIALQGQKDLPRGEQNFEAVLETQIINGRPGPPHVVATYIW
jgi:hypothetical protein